MDEGKEFWDRQQLPLPARAARNRTAFPLPILEDGDVFRFRPVHRVNLTRDHSSASENGVKAAFPGHEVFSADCTFHASPSYWSKSKDNNALFKCSSTNKAAKRAAMNGDFDALKNCPHVHMVPFLHTELVAFWKHKKGRDEPDVASAWYATYYKSNLSRILLAENYGLRGGMPADNNVIERSNRTDKMCRNYKKKTPLGFIRDTATHLHAESCADLDFFGDLKPAVHCGEFMGHVWRTIIANRDPDPTPCLLNLQFQFASARNGVPAGSFLVPKYRFIALLCRTHQTNDVAQIRQLIAPRRGTARGEKPLEVYKSLVRDPSAWLAALKEAEGYESHTGFKKLQEWTTTKFCCMRPINAGKHYNAVWCLRTIILNSGYDVIPMAAIVEKGNDGLVSCDCSTYLHYAWCYHACSIAMHRKIIIKFPPNMDPSSSFAGKGNGRGRPSSARRGGALEY